MNRKPLDNHSELFQRNKSTISRHIKNVFEEGELEKDEGVSKCKLASSSSATANKYYIGNPKVLTEDSIQNWMLSTLSVNHVISESLSLQKRILLEPIPSAKGYLKPIIDAMKKKRLMKRTV